jgi:hypothetical protein
MNHIPQKLGSRRLSVAPKVTRGIQTSSLKWLFVAAIALAVGEFMDSFSIADPTTGIVYAVLVAGCAVWIRMRTSRIPVVILLLLGGLELAALLFVYPNGPTPPALWRSAIFILLSTVVILLSILSLFGFRSTSSLQ